MSRSNPARILFHATTGDASWSSVYRSTQNAYASMNVSVPTLDEIVNLVFPKNTPVPGRQLRADLAKIRSALSGSGTLLVSGTSLMFQNCRNGVYDRVTPSVLALRIKHHVWRRRLPVVLDNGDHAYAIVHRGNEDVVDLVDPSKLSGCDVIRATYVSKGDSALFDMIGTVSGWMAWLVEPVQIDDAEYSSDLSSCSSCSYSSSDD